MLIFIPKAAGSHISCLFQQIKQNTIVNLSSSSRGKHVNKAIHIKHTRHNRETQSLIQTIYYLSLEGLCFSDDMLEGKQKLIGQHSPPPASIKK
jgi:hypothetical protein